MNTPQSNGYITYHVPQPDGSKHGGLASESPELKTYIREHALKYAGPEPAFTDESYMKWYEKLIKIENKVYEKYMKKWSADRPEAIQIVQPQQEQRENSPVSSRSSSENTTPSPRSTGSTTPSSSDSNSLQFEYDQLAAKYNQLLMEQKSINDIQQKFIELETYNKILLEQQSKNVTMDILQRKICELQKQNDAQNQVIQQLLEEKKQIKLENENLSNMNITIQAQHEQYENAKLLMQLEFIKYQQKYENLEKKYEALVLKDELREIKMNKLETEYKELQSENGMVKVQKTAVYAEWNAEQIVNWIVNLDSDRYNKYKDTLLINMEKEEIDGLCLDDLDKTDLYRLGIMQFKDKKDIYMNLRALVESKNN